MYSEIDRQLRKIKYRLPRQTNTPSTSGSNFRSNTRKPPVHAATANTTVAPAVFTPAVVPVSSGNPMDLSSTIAAVKGKKTSELGVRDICNRFDLCYYCKLQYPGKKARECPNKRIKENQLRSSTITDIDNIESICGGVTVNAGNV